MQRKKLLLSSVFLILFLPRMLIAKEESKDNKVDTGLGITHKRELEHFDVINLSGLGSLYLKQSATQNLSIEADNTILPLLKISVVNRVLNIEMREASSHEKAKIAYYLNVKTIKKINSSGGGSIVIEEGFNAQALNLSINNLGEAHIKKLNVGNLNVKLAGGATMEVSGVADQQSISINGAAEFNGIKLSGQVANVNINDMGVAKVNVSNSLTAAIIGEGMVQYCGHPNITRQATSSAAVISPLPVKDCK